MSPKIKRKINVGDQDFRRSIELLRLLYARRIRRFDGKTIYPELWRLKMEP
jgi:hypothetical protein